MRRLLEDGVYFTFLFQNATFIGGQHLKEEIRYMDLLSNILAQIQFGVLHSLYFVSSISQFSGKKFP